MKMLISREKGLGLGLLLDYLGFFFNFSSLQKKIGIQLMVKFSFADL